jgi:glucosamine--fructose-6-phosphate aminotransferase (isomerizing)
MSSEFQYAFDVIDSTSVLIAISQSGETADVLQSVKAAKQMGARILSIVNNPTSSLARISDLSLSIECGPEIGVAVMSPSISITLILCLKRYGKMGLMPK